jgi:hypothetical protein
MIIEKLLAQSYTSHLLQYNTTRLVSSLILSKFFFKYLLIEISNLIKELVAINSQLIDDLLKDRLNLHEGVEATAGLLAHDLLQGFDYINHGNLACILVIKERH